MVHFIFRRSRVRPGADVGGCFRGNITTRISQQSPYEATNVPKAHPLIPTRKSLARNEPFWHPATPEPDSTDVGLVGNSVPGGRESQTSHTRKGDARQMSQATARRVALHIVRPWPGAASSRPAACGNFSSIRTTTTLRPFRTTQLSRQWLSTRSPRQAAQAPGLGPKVRGTARPQPSDTEQAEDMPAFSLGGLGLGRNMRLLVLGLIGVLATVETWFWCVWAWRRWTGKGKDKNRSGDDV